MSMWPKNPQKQKQFVKAYNFLTIKRDKGETENSPNKLKKANKKSIILGYILLQFHLMITNYLFCDSTIAIKSYTLKNLAARGDYS